MEQKDKNKKNQLQYGIDCDLECAEVVCRKVSVWGFVKRCVHLHKAACILFLSAILTVAV